MRRALLALVPWVWCGCAGEEPVKTAPGPEAAPQELAQRWLDGHTRTCIKNEDCGTNLCDRSLSLWDDDQIGICVSLFRAQERWQRLVVASSIAKKAQENPELVDAIWTVIEERWAGVHDVEQVEGMFLLARHFASDRSKEFLRRVEAESEGSERLHAGISLAKMGDPGGLDAVGQASASSQPVLRVHAAWGAAEICNEESLRILEVLTSDPHPVVRQAAYLGANCCKSDEGLALKSKLKELAVQEEDPEPGSIWLE